MNYKKELKKLCQDIGYELHCHRKKYFEVDFPHAFFQPTLRTVKVYGWRRRDKRVYFSGLHEVGHIVNGHKVYNDFSDEEKRNEIQAWDWALGTCKIPPDEKVVKMIKECLRSYGVEEQRIERLLK